tara:strand:- start:731 stop:2401 length:1671 start_codon:yes stop_codon:yes gene_type:complete
MDLFKLKTLKIDKNHKSNTIQNLVNIQNIVNTFNYCLQNKKKCLVTDNTQNNPEMKDDITIVYKSQIYYLTWVNLIMTNKLINKKYSINMNFNVTPNIFNIFFIKLIDTHYEKCKQFSKNLIGNSKSFFGIYNSYDDCIRNVDNSLYFSFNIFTFILYRVKETDTSIIGKLFPTISIENGVINYNKVNFKCPASFTKIKSNIFQIKKRIVEFNQISKTNLESHNLNKKLEIFYRKNIIHNTYILKIKNTITNTILQNLYLFLICSYPFLDNSDNVILYDSDTFDFPKSSLSLFIKTIQLKKHLIIQLDSKFNAYVSDILTSIINYLQKLSSLSKVKVITKNIEYNYNDIMIHLVSEIYYIIISLIVYLPNLIKNFNEIKSCSYIHANYVFSQNEVKNLYNHKNNLFPDNLTYIKSILLKTLSIFTYNYYTIIRTNNNIDIVPIKENMSNDFILNLLDRSNKAELSKTLILNTTNNIFHFIKKDNIEYPYIIINIDNIDNSCIKSTSKVYTKCFTNVVPIFINVLYSMDNLHVSLSYKKEHQNFKNAFDEIINELVK